MSKILPKSMPNQSSQNVKLNRSSNENDGNDVIFAALYGGAKGEASSLRSSAEKSLMVTMMLEESGGKEGSCEELSDELMPVIASMQGSRGLGQKVVGCQVDILDDDPKSEQALTLPDAENPEALALSINGALLSETKGGEAELPKSAVTGLANMAFMDGEDSSNRSGDAAMRHNLVTANSVSKKFAHGDESNFIGQNKASSKFNGSQPLQPNSAKVSENLSGGKENSATKNMVGDIANLRALRSASLEQQNADIEAETAKGDFDGLNGKLGKNDLTGAGLKQMMASAAKPTFAGKAVSRLEGVKTDNDMARLTAASSSTLDNGSLMGGTAAKGSSTGQSGGQTGQQGGGQAGPQSGGSLLSSLNNLQMLDTAKDNWTEMLLQRVRNGLSGGRDQLEFQLNPRNLGKMRISLIMQNDRTNIQIQTETLAAASMLGDSEARLAQMFEAQGLRLGNLNSGQFQGFGGAGSDQQANQQSQNKTVALDQSDSGQDKGEVNAEIVAEGSDNLINIQA